MESLDYWRLCDELSFEQAAILIIGGVPGEIEAMALSGAELLPRSAARYYPRLDAARTAIVNAAAGKRLPAKLKFKTVDQYDQGFECVVAKEGDTIDPERSTVLVSDLKNWLLSRGLRTGFFFPEGQSVPDYLDPAHSRYAPKLAAAVRAWMACDDPKGRHPKQALMKWLREHSAEFGLADEEGRPNEQGIEECAKVANWKPSGGAPKTPET